MALHPLFDSILKAHIPTTAPSVPAAGQPLCALPGDRIEYSDDETGETRGAIVVRLHDRKGNWVEIADDDVDPAYDLPSIHCSLITSVERNDNPVALQTLTYSEELDAADAARMPAARLSLEEQLVASIAIANFRKGQVA